MKDKYAPIREVFEKYSRDHAKETATFERVLLMGKLRRRSKQRSVKNSTEAK